MVIGRNELLRRMSLPLDAEQALVVTPFVAPNKQLDEDALDLRLGSDFLITRSDRLAANVPGYAQSSEFQRGVHVPLGRYIVLPGHHTVLAVTLEFIKLPFDLSGMVLTKSSWARTFVTIETAPWIHPNYR